MADFWSELRTASGELRRNLFTARFMLAIFICPIIGIFLFVGAIGEKGFARLTFGDIYPAVSISLAGIVYLFLYRFLTRPVDGDEEPVQGDQRNNNPGPHP